MNERILVTYASRYGATGEIAERIGAVLREAGLPVDVRPVDSGCDPAAYRAVVLGSALYIGKWRKEAEAYLQANEQALAGRPVWLFSSGPTGEGDPVQLVDGERVPTGLRPAAERIHPRDMAVFHGHINPQKMNFIEKFAIRRVVKKPFGDYRQWDAIERWSRGIAGELNGQAD